MLRFHYQGRRGKGGGGVEGKGMKRYKIRCAVALDIDLRGQATKLPQNLPGIISALHTTIPVFDFFSHFNEMFLIFQRKAHFE